MHNLQINNLSNRSEILIYGPIGEGLFGDSTVTSESFRDQLKQIPNGTAIDLRINSPGGAVFEGYAIFEALKSRSKDITAYVDGQASSIASVIMLAASKIVAAENSWIMLHEPTMLAQGSSEDMQRYSGLLDGIAKQISVIYSNRTGKPESEMRELMRRETWLTGEQAMNLGFVDEVSAALQVAAISNLEWFRNVPAQLTKNKTGETQNIMATESIPNAGTNPADQRTPGVAASQTAHSPDNRLEVNALTQSLAILKESLAVEKKARILGELKEISASNAAVIFDDWKDKVVNDETMLATLRTLPSVSASECAVRTAIENVGKSAVEAYVKMKPGAARAQFRIENFADLERSQRDLLIRRNQPVNANTIAAALTPDVVADTVITVAPNKLAVLGRISNRFSTDRLMPRATVQVPFVSAGPTVLVNPASFESGDMTISNKPITVDHLSSPIHLTSDQIQKGRAIGNGIEMATNQLLDKISDTITALMVVGTFATGANIIGAGSTMTVAKLSAIFATCKNFPQKLLLLDGGHLAYLIPSTMDSFKLGQQGAYGFDGIFEHNRYTGATANSVGFCMSSSAILLASGLPIKGAAVAQQMQSSEVALPIGLTIEVNQWASIAGRQEWLSLDVLFGAGAGDTSLGLRIITA